MMVGWYLSCQIIVVSGSVTMVCHLLRKIFFQPLLSMPSWVCIVYGTLLSCALGCGANDCHEASRSVCLVHDPSHCSGHFLCLLGHSVLFPQGFGFRAFLFGLCLNQTHDPHVPLVQVFFYSVEVFVCLSDVFLNELLVWLIIHCLVMYACLFPLCLMMELPTAHPFS